MKKCSVLALPTVLLLGCTGAPSSKTALSASPSESVPAGDGQCAPDPARSSSECLPPATEEERAERRARGPVNVLDAPLETCSLDPLTGYFRTGRCETGPTDRGVHVVCAAVTEEFLTFTKAQGNDLSSARGSFPGLRPRDRWCLCASRWEEARANGVAPEVVLEATDSAALRVLELEALKRHAVGTQSVAKN